MHDACLTPTYPRPCVCPGPSVRDAAISEGTEEGEGGSALNYATDNPAPDTLDTPAPPPPPPQADDPASPAGPTPRVTLAGYILPGFTLPLPPISTDLTLRVGAEVIETPRTPTHAPTHADPHGAWPTPRGHPAVHRE